MPKIKKRTICKEPINTVFVPQNSASDELMVMTVDEYECIRLIDLEGLSQEECANRLGVARTTAQLIYNNARLIMAKALVLGKGIMIEGGNYVLCDGSPCCKNCHLSKDKKREKIDLPRKENDVMRIAVTYDNGEVFQHFGKTEKFKIFDVEDKRIVSSRITDSDGAGHGALAGMLANQQVDVLICGGIGGGAQMALANAGIELYAGATGNVDAVVETYLRGELVHAGATCEHKHGEGHACGDHGCGQH